MKTNSFFKLFFNSVCLLYFLNTNSVNAEGAVALKIRQLLETSKQQSGYFLFDLNHSYPGINELNNAVSKSIVLSLNQNTASQLLNERPDFIKILIPIEKSKTLTLLLYKANIFTPDFIVKDSDGQTFDNLHKNQLHYQGIIEGDYSTLVAISVFDEEVMGFISNANGNLVLGKITGDKDNSHILYNDRDLLLKNIVSCNTIDGNEHLIESPLLPGSTNTLANCIRFYWESDLDIFNDKGSVANATNYLTGLFNQSATIFTNDNIPVALSQLFVWSTADPYNATNTVGLLNQFQSYRNSFAGDIGHLLGYAGGGGVAAGFNGLCAANLDQSQCYSGISSSYANVPLYSWSVEVVTHEQGHLLGSRHTHACVWNGNNTAIDGCGPSAGYGYEGNCSGAPIPANGGTIMSYCHLVSAGINFANGFGLQPATAILNKYNSSPCLTNCTGVFCLTPQNLISTNITGTTANVQWDTVMGATGYNIRYRIAGTTTWNNVVSSTNNIVLSTLLAGTTYEWQVQTDCSTSTSNYSSSAYFVTIPLTCNAPLNLTTTSISSSSAKFNWDAVGGAISYNVFYRQVGLATWSSGNVLVNEFYVYSLNTLTNYEWYVVANCSGGGVSTSSVTIQFTTVASPMPAACYPFAGNANDVSGNNHHGIVAGAALTYDRFGNANSAYLFNGTSANISVPSYNSISSTSNEFSISFWAISYQFKSQSAIMLFPDDPYDRLSVHINYSHNGVPATFWDYGSISGGGRLYILPDSYVSQWNHYVFISSEVQNKMWIYRNGVMVASSNSADNLVNRNKQLLFGGGMASGNSNFYFSGAIDDIVIYNEVLSQNEITTLFQQNTPCIVSAVSNENSNASVISVFPNPSNGSIQISSANQISFTFDLYDATGKLLLKSQNDTSGKTNINTGIYQSGVYLLTVKTNTGVINKRIVIR